MPIQEENIKLIFGLKVRQLRLDKKLSLSEVAKKSRISASYLNEIEKGKKYPKADKIVLLSNTLGVSYDWLVSLKLNQSLAPIAELIESDVLRTLPLDIFGLEPSDLLELISNTPAKVSALISTLVEIARNYDMRVENFYQSVLRSYQEMHENYFEEIEKEVQEFRRYFKLSEDTPLALSDLYHILETHYDYDIDDLTLNNYPELRSLRSTLIVDSKPKLLLNSELSDAQKRFTLGRELGYLFLKATPRLYTFSWIKINSFEEILNNFKASYFSAALLIPQKGLINDLETLFKQDKWDKGNKDFLNIMYRNQATPEMLIHRLTNIAPKFFGLPHLFFLRFYKNKAINRFDLNKELHLAGLYNPHGTMLNEHYCRRWVSLNIIKNFENMQAQQSEEEVLCAVQRSQYIDSENEYFCISLAYNIKPTPDTNASLTIGFLMNDEFKQKVKFWNDPSIPIRKVGVSCERCSAVDCQERAAPAKALEEKRKTERMQKHLDKLIEQLQLSENYVK